MRILLFYRKFYYNLFNYYTDELKKSLERRGVICDSLELADDDSKSKVFDTVRANHYDLALVFNSEGIQDYEIDGENLWEKCDVVFYNIIVDHPVDHQKELRSSCKKLHVICIDEEHEHLTKMWFPGIKSVNFLPIGCAQSNLKQMDEDAWKKRRQDIVYVGVREDLNVLGQTISEYPPNMKKLILNILDLMLDNRELSYFAALRQVLDGYGMQDISAEDELDYAVICRVVSRFYRAYAREEVVRYLLEEKHDWSIHIYGSGWEQLACESLGNVVLHPPIEYSRTGALYGDSKVVLNVMSHYKNALLDRIPSAMAAGACILSEKTPYLAKKLPDNGICFYDPAKPNLIPEMVDKMLSNDEETFRIAKNGFDYAISHLSWDDMAEGLLSIFSSYGIVE